jgi:hypothetical protein
MADPDFVGRVDLVEQILGDVGGADRTGTFFDIEGIPGIGKTCLLDHLAKLTRPGDVVTRINGGEFEARGSRTGTSTPDEDADLMQFRRLLREALEGLPDDEMIEDTLNWLTENSPGAAKADFVHDPDPIIERATGAANNLGRNLAATQVRFLVLVDDFHLLAGRPIGQWLITWLAGIKAADVVVTREGLSGAGNPGLPARAIRLPLGNLSREDVEAYLKSHPDIGPDVSGILPHVWDFTGGYPRALVLVADLIKGSSSRDNAIQLIGQLTALQGGLVTQLEALVNRILDLIDDEDLQNTLYRVCVTRHFDGPLVERLMNVDERRAHTLIDQLTHYSFVRRSDGDHSFLAVSDFVRRIGEGHLGAAQTQLTHSLAADYYWGLIADALDGDETSYQSWFRYEQSDFQALERDWLYHLSRLTGNSRRSGRIDIAKIFLDAFWWWGSYIPFAFCEQILADWSEATLDNGEDRAWGVQLRTVYDSFPKGWRKADTPTDQWNTVLEELQYLWHLAHFEQADPHDQKMRHIRGILDFYLADAERYIDPSSEEADERLDDAVHQFAADEDADQDEDEWNTAWVEYYRADLAVARKQTDQAISLAKESATRHTGLDDHELAANLHRVCADARWVGQDPGRALDNDARAVLHAYRFQVQDVQDDYTDAFQREMIERSTERLTALHDDDQDEGHAVLRSACARIRAFFGPYWSAAGAGPVTDVGLEVIRALDERRLDDVAGLLFPARPTVLGYQGTPYAKTCVRVTHQMRRELAQPPDTPLPPAET